MSKANPTIRDVARLAGVSHQTVSRVINDKECVLPETRMKVEAAIAELGFRPSAIARSMADGSTRTFACISPNLTDFTFCSLIDSAETYAREHGYFLISASAPDAESFAVLIEQLISSRRAEGLLVINPYADERHRSLPGDVPVVLLGARPRSKGLTSVALDDVHGGVIAAQHLISLGHQKIAVISGPREEDCAQDRLSGCKKAMEEAGLEFDERRVYAGDWSASSGQAGVDHFRAHDVDFTALFVQNDRMAVGAIDQLQKSGLNVPQDVSVVGFDDMPLASYFNPPLTTIRQDISTLGREASRLLIEAREGKSRAHQQLLFTPELVLRNSTSKAPDRR